MMWYRLGPGAGASGQLVITDIDHR
jgi:hypothetical protein